MKKFTVLIFCFMMVLSCCLTGCSTFSIDYVKFYNETVACVLGQKISRYELLSSYDNYGNEYYVSQQGMSEKEALNKTLETMINRELLVDYAKKEDKYKLSEYDINNIYKEVLDSLDQSYQSFLTRARDIYGLEQPKEAEEESTDTAYLKKDYKYKKRATLITGDIIKYESEEERIESYALGDNAIDFVTEFASKSKSDIITKLYATFMKNAYDNRHVEDNFYQISNKAVSLMVKNLISNEYYLRDENGKSYSTKTEDVLKRYIEKIYDSQLDSAYIANVEEYYLNNQSELQNLTTKKLLDKFVSLTETDFAKYVNAKEDYYNYLKTIGTDAELVYYTPDDTSAEFGYFLHVLLPIDEAEMEKIDAEKAKLEAGYYDEIAYQNAVESIIAPLTHQERSLETGLLLEGDKYLNDILDEYESVTSVDQFFDFMFRYTSDTATLTADMPYVIGYDGDTKYSGMVEEFTDEAIRLLKSEEEYITKKENYIITQYGIHLLCELDELFGEVKAEFKYSDRNSMVISLDKTLENNLYYTQTNKLTEKTYFDLLFDLVYPASEGEVYATDNGYTEMESSLLTGMYNEENVTIYTTKVKGTLKLL